MLCPSISRNPSTTRPASAIGGVPAERRGRLRIALDVEVAAPDQEPGEQQQRGRRLLEVEALHDVQHGHRRHHHHRRLPRPVPPPHEAAGHDQERDGGGERGAGRDGADLAGHERAEHVVALPQRRRDRRRHAEQPDQRQTERQQARRERAFDSLGVAHSRSPRRVARSISRRASRSAIEWRLSTTFRPRARASSTLARPSLKYIRSGTIARPALRRALVQALDLAAVQEQAAVARRRVVRAVPLRIRLDRARDEEHLATADHAERLGQADAPQAERLHLRAEELDAGLEPLQHLVLVEGAPVRRDRLLARRTHRRILLPGRGAPVSRA